MRAPITITPPDLGAIQSGDFGAIADAIDNINGVANQLASLIAGRIGAWKDVPYDATNFSANAAGSWQVPANGVTDYSYLVIDDLLVMHLEISGGIIGNALTTQLKFKVPGGFRIKGSHTSPIGITVWSGNGANGFGAILVDPVDDTKIMCFAGSAFIVPANFPQSAGGGTVQDTLIGFIAVFQIVPRAGN